MVKANELRIGNWIIDPKDGQFKTVNLYQLNKCMIDDINCTYLPIPLTPDILLKCGFDKKDEDYYFWNTDEFEIGWDSFGLDIIFRSTTISYGLEHITSLHQLQNFYYALTGEELPIQNLKTS